METLKVKPESRDLRYLWLELKFHRDLIHKVCQRYLYPLDPRDAEQDVAVLILSIPAKYFDQIKGPSAEFITSLSRSACRQFKDREFRYKFIAPPHVSARELIEAYKKATTWINDEGEIQEREIADITEAPDILGSPSEIREQWEKEAEKMFLCAS